MEIPDRIKGHLDGESVQAAVSLGDEDVICFTPSRTLLYRGEGLLSDESLTVYDHDVERLNVSEGRRKTSFELEYVDSVESFKVTNNRAQAVLTRLLAGILSAKDVLDEEESVSGVFLFSELTVVVTEARLVKHVGSYVWDPDFEEYPYSEVTGLDFEEGSVATQVVISVGGRPQRIKAPSDEAKKLRRTLSEALFSYHDVQSLAALNEKIGEDSEDDERRGEGGFTLDDSISPLVGDSSEGEESEREESPQQDPQGTDTTPTVAVGDTAGSEGESQPDPAGHARGIDPDEFEEMQAQLSKLTAAVETQQDQLAAQNEQIEAQRETIERLIEELRRQL